MTNNENSSQSFRPRRVTSNATHASRVVSDQKSYDALLDMMNEAEIGYSVELVDMPADAPANDVDPLHVELTAIAVKYSVTIVDVLMNVADAEESPVAFEAHRAIVKHVGYMSDSVIEDLLEDYAPEMIEDDE